MFGLLLPLLAEVLADLITGIQYTAFCQENGKQPTTITVIF
jgi:hypothetical protein